MVCFYKKTDKDMGLYFWLGWTWRKYLAFYEAKVEVVDVEASPFSGRQEGK